MRIAPRPPAGPEVSASSEIMFSPKQAEPSTSTWQSSDELMTHTENESAAVTSRPTIVVPAPATTTRVSKLLTVSRPGSARCSQAIRAPPITTETIAAAPMYHHKLD